MTNIGEVQGSGLIYGLCKELRAVSTMSVSETYNRRAWDDRFRQPAIEQLRADLPEDAAGLFDRLREHLSALDGVVEEVVWYGDCWRWTVQYIIKGQDEALAMLVPSPEDLQLVMPFERGMIDKLPVNQMKRAIRDGLDLAREPFDTRWGVWSVQFANLMDDMTGLIDRKYKLVCTKR